MKSKLIITAFLLTITCTLKAQNCINVNQSNIAGINNVINNLSANGGGCIEIEYGNYYNVPSISLKSNIVLKIYGNLYRNYGIIGITNCENVSVLGDNVGGLIYDAPELNTTAKGIQIKNSVNVNINGLRINGFGDKGILVRGPNTKDIKIKNNTISGAVGSTGVGIAVSDDQGGVSFCNIESNSVFNNRIGISVNKSKYINIIGNHSYANDLHGIGLDGIISLSGDGPQNCIISNNQVYNNGGTCESGKTKSGIYLGNGAQKNLISNNIVRNNRCYGIFYYEESSNQNSSYNNSFINNQIIENEKWGIRLVNSKRAIISNNQIIQNGYLTETDEQGNVTKQGTGGILLDGSNKNIVSSNNIILNGQIGVKYINSTGNKVETNIIDGQPISTNN
jgi:parallel beta-helix repeat protein